MLTNEVLWLATASPTHSFPHVAEARPPFLSVGLPQRHGGRDSINPPAPVGYCFEWRHVRGGSAPAAFRSFRSRAAEDSPPQSDFYIKVAVLLCTKPLLEDSRRYCAPQRRVNFIVRLACGLPRLSFHCILSMPQPNTPTRQYQRRCRFQAKVRRQPCRNSYIM